jgi:hypothetical protein
MFRICSTIGSAHPLSALGGCNDDQKKISECGGVSLAKILSDAKAFEIGDIQEDETEVR